MKHLGWAVLLLCHPWLGSCEACPRTKPLPEAKFEVISSSDEVFLGATGTLNPDAVTLAYTRDGVHFRVSWRPADLQALQLWPEDTAAAP